MVSQPDILIEAKALSYHYSGEGETALPALSGINLAISRGEYLALIGPNGSGKTTLLKLFNALLLPSSGEVKVGGLIADSEENLTIIRRKCGMIFQNPDNQLVATTVEEDIAFGLENLALPSAEIRQRVDEVAEMLGLTHLLLKPPHLLSGGEKQRVAIAGVLAMQPECILMDEPTAMLDPASRRDVMNAVRTLNKEQGLAVIHVTHFPEEAVFAHRVLVLAAGQIVADSTPEKVLTNLDLLHNLGLASTTAVELAALLRKDGFSLPPELLYTRELVYSLCLSEQKS